MTSEKNKKTTTNPDRKIVVSEEMTRHFASIYASYFDHDKRLEKILKQRREKDKKQISLDAGI